MKGVNPYLNFNGNSKEAFDFYRSVFGGEFTTVMKFGDNPQCGEMTEADKDKIMHISLPLGSSGNVLMASDSVESLGQKLTVGNNVYISLSPDTKDEADQIFKGLSDGGKVEMPMQDMFWGYWGCFTDKFGVQWMLSVDNGTQPA